MADAPILPTQPIRNKEAEPIQSGSFTVKNPVIGGTIYFKNPTDKIGELRKYLEGAKRQFPTPTNIEDLFPTQATRK